MRDYLRIGLLYLDPRLVHDLLINRPLRLLTGGLSRHLALRHSDDSVHLEDGGGYLLNALDFPDLLKLTLADLLAIKFKGFLFCKQLGSLRLESVNLQIDLRDLLRDTS